MYIFQLRHACIYLIWAVLNQNTVWKKENKWQTRQAQQSVLFYLIPTLECSTRTQRHSTVSLLTTTDDNNHEFKILTWIWYFSHNDVYRWLHITYLDLTDGQVTVKYKNIILCLEFSYDVTIGHSNEISLLCPSCVLATVVWQSILATSWIILHIMTDKFCSKTWTDVTAWCIHVLTNYRLNTPTAFDIIYMLSVTTIIPFHSIGMLLLFSTYHFITFICVIVAVSCLRIVNFHTGILVQSDKQT